jgi:type II secretion system protein L
MKTLGVSISRNHLSALLREQSLLSSRLAFSCTVPCREPFGGPEDAARLAEEVRKGTGQNGLPPVVLSLPPSWTYLRQVDLPVEDLRRAKKIHVAELEGNLPIEDDEILSDLLPSPPGPSGRFLAIAARREAVEKAVKVFADAGFPLDRVVTDHVSILSAVLSGENPTDRIFLSTLSDIVILRVEEGSIRWARQFPAAMASDADGLAKEWREILRADAAAAAPLPVTVLGDVPAALSSELAGATRFAAPSGAAGDASLLAYGAAHAPSLSTELGGFSLRTSAGAESERERATRWVRIASAAAAVAVLSAVGSLEVARWAGAKKVASVRAQIRKEFSEAVPGVKVAVQETAQIREKMQSLRRQQKELGTDSPGPSALLMKVSQALPAKENIAIREVSFDAGRLRLAGEAGAAPLVETYRSALSAALGPEMNVTVQESAGSARAGGLRFTILIEKGSPGRAS